MLFRSVGQEDALTILNDFVDLPSSENRKVIINNNVGKFSFAVKLDNLTEGLENIFVAILDNPVNKDGKVLATNRKITILDTSTVVENKLTANEAEVVGALVVKDLVVKGSINTDNQSWKALSDSIGIDAMKRIDEEFQKHIVESVRETIKTQGIDF